MSELHDLREVIRQFRVPGDFREAAPRGRGHINDTFRVVLDDGGTSAAASCSASTTPCSRTSRA